MKAVSPRVLTPGSSGRHRVSYPGESDRLDFAALGYSEGETVSLPHRPTREEHYDRTSEQLILEIARVNTGQRREIALEILDVLTHADCGLVLLVVPHRFEHRRMLFYYCFEMVAGSQLQISDPVEVCAHVGDHFE